MALRSRFLLSEQKLEETSVASGCSPKLLIDVFQLASDCRNALLDAAYVRRPRGLRVGMQIAYQILFLSC